MANGSRSVLLLKVLLAAAWADSRLSEGELNYIKELARRLRLTDEEWFALEPYLEDAPTEEETEAIVEDLRNHAGSNQERRAIAEHIRGVVEADDAISADEQEFMERCREVLEGASSLDLLVSRIRALVGSASPRSTLDLDEFVRNKILFKLRRRLGDGEVTPDMHRLALLGGLMGIVAQADGDIDERELEAIRRELEARGRFEDEALDVLVTIIREESVRGLDRYRLIAEYSEGSTISDRKELLDLLFLVAAADGGLTHAELEELRSISSSLHLSHKQYIDSKLSALGS